MTPRNQMGGGISSSPRRQKGPAVFWNTRTGPGKSPYHSFLVIKQNCWNFHVFFLISCQS